MWENKSNVNYKYFKPADGKKTSEATVPVPQQKQAPKQKKIRCPHCGFEQMIIEEALSVFCKNCNKRITMGTAPQAAQGQKAGGFTHFKITACPKCSEKQNVPNNALSSFCKKCGHRINLQDYEIKGKFNGPLDTKGTLYITISGDVKADASVGNAVIEGKLVGKIIAEGKVELKSTARLYGDVIAAKLIVNDGALFVGNSIVPPNISQQM